MFISCHAFDVFQLRDAQRVRRKELSVNATAARTIRMGKRNRFQVHPHVIR